MVEASVSWGFTRVGQLKGGELERGHFLVVPRGDGDLGATCVTLVGAEQVSGKVQPWPVVEVWGRCARCRQVPPH